VSLCSCIALTTTPKQQVVKVPFVFENNRIILQVKVNGKGPFNMMLATGSPESATKFDPAKQIGLRPACFPLYPHQQLNELT
jgi:hypothetical protein